MKIWLAVVLGLLAGCATDSQLEKVANSGSEDPGFRLQKAWLTRYKATRDGKDPEACKSFIELAQNHDFLLSEAASLRAMMFCEDEALNAAGLPIWEDLQTEKSNDEKAVPLSELWLNPIKLEVALTKMQSMKPSERLKALVLAAKLSAKTSEKISFYTQALELGTSQRASAEELLEWRESLYKIAPRLDPDSPPKLWMRVGQDWLQQREFKKAREFFDKIIQNPESTKDEVYAALKAMRNSFKLQQDKPRVLQVSRDILKWTEKNGGDSRILDAELSLARVLWTQGQLPEAQKLLLKARRELSSRVGVEEIDLVLGKMEEEQGHYEQAIAIYSRGIPVARAKSLTQERLLFARAWSYRRLGKSSEAVKDLETLIQTLPAKDTARYQFWRAKTAHDSALLQKLMEDDPLGYYGLLASRELGKPLPALQSTEAPSLAGAEPDRSRSFDYQIQKMVRSLALAGEKDSLEIFVSRHVPPEFQSNLFILKNFAESGLYQPLFATLSSLTPEQKREILNQAPELIFPRRFLTLIDQSAKASGIDSELPLSIIRQESSFDPRARSEADAFGLMQVLPSVAQRFKVSIQGHEDLYQPEVNIPLGVKLLAELKDKYKGSLILTAAAYNANEEAIGHWLKTRYHKDTLEFIEDIPYEETRGYVKLVMRNYIFYRRLAQPNNPLVFPEDCLTVL